MSKKAKRSGSTNRLYRTDSYRAYYEMYSRRIGRTIAKEAADIDRLCAQAEMATRRAKAKMDLAMALEQERDAESVIAGNLTAGDIAKAE